MHNKGSVSSFNTACIGDSLLNWATKFIADLAHDGTVAVDVPLHARLGQAA
ncbi:hypothetical protein J2857_004529 [Neorhizobium galegae]|uniref:hypothetical protein n=1 Tax=Neorhizobium galegae TaxID=399 RepID=UPI001AE4848D|nr:hypothetical protein [Neorhizobium galegae]MBP2561739.1 hypothetical protein [Neorhizobium galegae]